MFLLVLVLPLLAVRSFADLNVTIRSYYNDFIEPSYILGKNWSTTTDVAQQSIIRRADRLAAKGPWCTHIPSYKNRCFLTARVWKLGSRHHF
jgi:hypothetical protein